MREISQQDSLPRLQRQLQSDFKETNIKLNSTVEGTAKIKEAILILISFFAYCFMNLLLPFVAW